MCEKPKTVLQHKVLSWEYKGRPGVAGVQLLDRGLDGEYRVFVGIKVGVEREDYFSSEEKTIFFKDLGEAKRVFENEVSGIESEIHKLELDDKWDWNMSHLKPYNVEIKSVEDEPAVGEKTLKELSESLGGHTIDFSGHYGEASKNRRSTLSLFSLAPGRTGHNGIWEYTIARLRDINPNTAWVIVRRGVHNYDVESPTYYKDEFLTTAAGSVDDVLMFDCPTKAAEHMAKVLSPPAKLIKLHWVTSCGCKGKRIS